MGQPIVPHPLAEATEAGSMSSTSSRGRVLQNEALAGSKYVRVVNVQRREQPALANKADQGTDSTVCYIYWYVTCYVACYIYRYVACYI